MRLLLDTHIVVALVRRELERAYPRAASAIADHSDGLCCSVATLWEVAIKTRLGKLDTGLPLDSLPTYLTTAGVPVLPITENHVLAHLHTDIPTRDPFDRLLVAIAESEGMKLLSADRRLAGHPHVRSV